MDNKNATSKVTLLAPIEFTSNAGNTIDTKMMDAIETTVAHVIGIILSTPSPRHVNYTDGEAVASAIDAINRRDYTTAIVDLIYAHKAIHHDGTNFGYGPNLRGNTKAFSIMKEITELLGVGKLIDAPDAIRNLKAQVSAVNTVHPSHSKPEPVRLKTRMKTAPEMSEVVLKRTGETLFTFRDEKHCEDYRPLLSTLIMALDQAARGKGDERHATSAPFIEQPTLATARMLESNAGLAQQVIKKTVECRRLPSREHRIAELLGVINYAAMMILFEDTADSVEDEGEDF